MYPNAGVFKNLHIFPPLVMFSQEGNSSGEMIQLISCNIEARKVRGVIYNKADKKDPIQDVSFNAVFSQSPRIVNVCLIIKFVLNNHEKCNIFLLLFGTFSRLPLYT